ncbi:MAG: hypothetical protein NVS3B2_17110 [Ramlibacter sp.]
MKANHCPLLVLLAALTAGSALAQVKPVPRTQAAPAPATPKPAAGAATPAAEAEPTAEAKEMAAAATLAASGWLSLLDRRDWGRAWETSASMFRRAVPLPAWMDGIPKARDIGNFVDREPAEAVYRNTLEGYPRGDYVTVIYASKFSGKEDLVEIVTTAREPDGKWRVTGYSTR